MQQQPYPTGGLPDPGNEPEPYVPTNNEMPQTLQHPEDPVHHNEVYEDDQYVDEEINGQEEYEEIEEEEVPEAYQDEYNPAGDHNLQEIEQGYQQTGYDQPQTQQMQPMYDPNAAYAAGAYGQQQQQPMQQQQMRQQQQMQPGGLQPPYTQQQQKAYQQQLMMQQQQERPMTATERKNEQLARKRRRLTCWLGIGLCCLVFVLLCAGAILYMWLSDNNPLEDDDSDDPAPEIRATTFAPTMAPAATTPTPPAASDEWSVTDSLLATERNAVNSDFGAQVAFVDNILVVGLPRLDAVDQNDQGAFQTFGRSAMGQTFQDEARTIDTTAQQFGSALDMVQDGNIVYLLVGAMRSTGALESITRFGTASVYATTDNGNSWTRIGGVFRTAELFEEAGSLFGYSATIVPPTDTTPLRVAVGAPSTSINANLLDVGRVYTYEYDGTNWVELIPGQQIQGTSPDSFVGASVDFNVDGKTLLIGAPEAFEAASWSSATTIPAGNGQVMVMEYQEGNPGSWNSLAVQNNGQGVNMESFGSTVKWISSIQFAVGGPTLNTNQGSIKIFEWNGSTYEQLGSSIMGASGERVGDTLCGNDSGRVGFGTATGVVRVFEFDGTNWQQVGEDLTSSTNSPVVSCFVSADGSTVGAGLENEEVVVWDFNGP